MSLLSGPRGAAPGSARLRRSSRPSPDTPSAWRGASHGAGGAHLAVGQVPGSPGDAPTPAARTPPAPPPLPLPGAPGEAPPAGEGNACAEGGEGRPPPGAILNRLSACGGGRRCSLGSAAEALREWGCGCGCGGGCWFRGDPGTEGSGAVAEGAHSEAPGLGGSCFLAARRCSPSRVTARARPSRPRGKQVGGRATLVLPPAFKRKTKLSEFTGVGYGACVGIMCSAPFHRSHGGAVHTLLYPHADFRAVST
ncbi:translation initiation factor IF-2-like [Vidua chalybeata]|uniref:translation initiation factor IF-2-like n=1 Tax=Vidua chalybeata TaxID=81927 RepID=UPI0023A8FDAF|nr:translation initiation factor IF-2-like [Vidua chalybeata]